MDEMLLLRRCALPVVPNATVDHLLSKLSVMQSLAHGMQIDMSMFWMTVLPMDQSGHPLQAVSEISGVGSTWLTPMQKFCRAYQPGPGSKDQSAQVCDLLCRCGWANEPRALWLVLKILRWDTVELLHFALQLLRQQHAKLWLPLAAALEKAFGSDVVLPLRKALDPELTLALVIAAPESVVRRFRRINE